MTPTNQPLTIRFSTLDDHTTRLQLARPDLGEARGRFVLPYDVATWRAIMRALEPQFELEKADEATRAALQPLGDLKRLPQTAGAALAGGLLADEEMRTGFEVALGLAEGRRQALPVELRFGLDCDPLAALPWELLHHKERFLVADTSIALSRYPEGAFPPTPALADLPLRVLLVLCEPTDASPILPQEARRQLLHGLRSLDEVGAVIVDLLRPPTFDRLVEAVTGGSTQVLIFYGHGVYEAAMGGRLLFEDEFGGGDLVQAGELGAALRNSDVRLVLLGACQSAQVGPLPQPFPQGRERGEGAGMWRGTAPALLRAGVPLAVGMQVSMRVDAALAFMRQFTLSLAAGKPVTEAVAEGRKPLVRRKYGGAWFIPALYGRPAGDTRLFDPAQPLPAGTADLRAQMKARRAEIGQLEAQVGQMGMVTRPQEMAQLRAARASYAQARAQLARRTPVGYSAVTSLLYGVPSNPVFVGRAAELREVAEELVGEQPVVIWGAGGIGKTALAAEVAQRQGWRFPAGVLWLDCRGGPALDTLLERIGGFCGLVGMEQIPPEHKETAARAALAGLGERGLLVWDNSEDVWPVRAVRQFVETLPPNCQCLLTTREDPRQAMWPTIELQPLVDEAMMELFGRLASAARVKVGTPADLEAIPRIIGHLQGHPLALLLVVPLAKDRGLARTWRELQARPFKGVAAAFELSTERLSELQQRLFARLSVWTIPFEWEAAEAMMAGVGAQHAAPPPGAAEEAAAALDVLKQRALLTWDGARYGYHALLRQYAYSKLREMEDPRAVHRLAAEYLRAKITDEEQTVTPEEVLEEVDQWEKAEAWEEFARCAGALVGSLDRLGYWSEIRQRLERARAAVQEHLDSPPDLEAGLLNDLAAIVFKSAEWDEAIDLWQGASERYQAAGDEQGLAQTLGNLGAVYMQKGEWDRAIEFYEKSLETKERVGDIHGMAQTYNNLGLVYADKGEWDRAIEFYQQALQMLERVGDIHGMAQTYNNLGTVYMQQGKWDRAIEFYEKSLEISERVGDIHGMAVTFMNLGNIYTRKGEWDRAIEFYQQALQMLERVGDIHGMAQTYNNLGTVYMQQGKWDRAIEFYEKSLEISERVGDIHGMAQTLGNLGLVYMQKGEWDRAIEFYEKSLETKERMGDIHGLAQTYTNLGSVYARKGEWDRAIEFYGQALATMERVGDIHGLAQTYGNLGSVYLQKGEWDRAIEFYQQALQTMERVGDIHGMAVTFMNLGSIYMQKGEWDRAIEFYQQALQTMEQVGDIHGLAQTYGNLGNVYSQKGEWDRAIEFYEQALQTMERVGDIHGMAVTFMNLGTIYMQKGEWDRAIEFYEQALQTLERVGDIHGVAQTFGNLGLFYQARGDTEQAAHYMAQAYLIFVRLGAAPEAQQAGGLLVDILGSVEAANEYLAQMAEAGAS